MVTVIYKWIYVGLVLSLLALAVHGCGHATDYTADWTSVIVPENTFVTTAANASEEEYKSRCLHLDWKEVADYKTHRGEDVYFKGPAFLAGPTTNFDFLGALPACLGTAAFPLGPKQFEQYLAAAYVLWPGRVPGIADRQGGDANGPVVEVWGESQGSLGSDRDVVFVRARYITVHGD
jgi:hypothetical protein